MIFVFVPSLLSEAELARDPRAVIVWVEVYRTKDRLAAEIVADWHRGVGYRVLLTD